MLTGRRLSRRSWCLPQVLQGCPDSAGLQGSRGSPSDGRGQEPTCEHREHSASCSAELGGATDNSENAVNGGHVLAEEDAGLGDAADGA